MKKKVAVILSGCGVYDGSEIHEAMATLLALENHGFETYCFAPDVDQMHVVDHIKGTPMPDEKRNVLTESARIARGKIEALDATKMAEMDALVLPGGYGAAKNLCNYAVAGTEMEINEQVLKAIQSIHDAGKPIVSLCISPVILAKIFNEHEPLLTVGGYGDDAKNVEAMGARHQVTAHEEYVVDKDLKIITTPCYMMDATVGQIFRGVDKAIAQLEKMI
jgi:enhancing lycopene biosynthesis protein 2